MYIFCVILISLSVVHPPYCIISLLFAFGYSCVNKGFKASVKILYYILPAVIFINLLNSVLNPFGENLLADIGVVKIYRETFINGLYYSAAMISVIFWSLSGIIETSNIFQSRLFPRISFMVSLTIGLIPEIRNSFTLVNRQRKFEGDIYPKKGIIKKTRYISESISILAYTIIQKSMDSARALKSLGYCGEYVPIKLVRKLNGKTDSFIISFFIIISAAIINICTKENNRALLISLILIIIVYMFPTIIKIKGDLKWNFLK